jgi:hypothetical protein
MPELPAKMSCIEPARGMRDFLDGLAGGKKHFLGLVQLGLQQENLRRNTGRGFEFPRKVESAQAGAPGHG